MMRGAEAGSANSKTTTLANAIFSTSRPRIWRIIANPPEDDWNSCVRNSLHEISSQKSRDGVEVVDDGRRGQRCQKPAAVALGPEPGIEDGQDAAVAPVSDQTAESLPQGQDGQRDLILVERLAAARANRLDPCGHHRLARRCKRQLVDDHAAQGFAD